MGKISTAHIGFVNIFGKNAAKKIFQVPGRCGTAMYEKLDVNGPR
jgi:hypothetical protein